MHGHAGHRRGPAHGAARIDQVRGAVGRSADLAGIAVLIGRTTAGAGAAHVPIGQRHPVRLAVSLLDLTLDNGAGLFQPPEDQLAERPVLGRMRRVVVVEPHVEAVEVRCMLLVHLLDELLRLNPGRPGADHDRRAVRVVRAEVEAPVAAHPLKADPNVGLHVLHQVPEVDGPVRIGQS